MITVFLAEPEHPGNIGSVCRVMANFGITDLVLINPQTQLTQETRNLAKNAQHVVDRIQIADWPMLDDYDVVIATAGKNTTEQNILRSPLTPREAAEKMKKITGRVALLFGRESDGLTNAELARADFVITIPTTKDFPSMNLSHSVAIILAEYFAARAGPRFETVKPEEKKILYEKMNELVDTIDYPTPGKRITQQKIWRSILGRAVLTRAEARAALGLFRALGRQRIQSSTHATVQKARKK